MSMRIVRGSSGSFLCPPGHPNLTFSIEDGPRRDPNLIASLDYALEPENTDVPESVRTRVERLFADAHMVCSELWMRMVYGYFHNCYSIDGKDRSVSHLVSAGPPQRHLGYLHVKQFFPEHEPREDLIENGGDYGSKPCGKCGTTVQYEAKVDGYAEAITARQECSAGGIHIVSLDK